jgi:hypothetical protein
MLRDQGQQNTFLLWSCNPLIPASHHKTSRYFPGLFLILAGVASLSRSFQPIQYLSNVFETRISIRGTYRIIPDMFKLCSNHPDRDFRYQVLPFQV